MDKKPKYEREFGKIAKEIDMPTLGSYNPPTVAQYKNEV